MILFWYLTRRFLSYVFSITFLLTFLFNFIEFFEKLMRAKQTSVAVITYFLRLNFVPTFFDLLAIGTWLGTCFLLKELCWRHEWDLLNLLTYIPGRLLTFAMWMGISISLFALVAHEQYVAPLAFKAERFKQEKLKQGVKHRLVTTWLELDNNRMCYFSVLDPQTGDGEDLLLISMSPQFLLERMVRAPHFHVDFKTMNIHIPHGMVVDSGEQKEQSVTDISLSVPAFFSQLSISLEAPLLWNLSKKLMFAKHLLPRGVYDELLGSLLLKIGYFLQILLYPLLTVCVFMCIHHPVVQWIAALSVYPVMLVSTQIVDILFHYGLSPLVLLLHYLLFIIMALVCMYRMRRAR